MATAISPPEAQSSGKLPSQTIVNPRENASAIILRSGKEVEILVKAAPASLKQENEQNVVADQDIPMTMRYLSVSFHLFLIINQYLLSSGFSRIKKR